MEMMKTLLQFGAFAWFWQGIMIQEHDHSLPARLWAGFCCLMVYLLLRGANKICP